MNYKEEILKLLRKYELQEQIAGIFYEFFAESVLQRFGMTEKDIDNFCTIKNIITNFDDCLKDELKEISEEYIRNFVDKFFNLLCDFEKDSLYEFILKALETGFYLANDGKTIFDFYKIQNILSIHIIKAIRKYSHKFDIFELTASFVKFSNFVSELVSLAYYEKILTMKVSELYEKAFKDPLTGLYNRNKLSDIKIVELSRLKRYKFPLSICLMDIDNFKTLNDTYGHVAGDEVLRKLGEVILNNIRKADIPIRFGGEEFMILFTHTPLDRAKIACEKLMNKIREIKVYLDNGDIITFTVSIGLTEVKEDDEDFNRVVERADKALYEAKRKGKNRIEIVF